MEAEFDIKSVQARVEKLRAKHQARDARAAEVRAVRNGNWDLVAPDLFSDEWPRPVVANRVDVYARHVGAALAPLPNFTCTSASSTSEAARRFAHKRQQIVNNYITRSRLSEQMQTGGDHLNSYGMIVGHVVPDLKDKFPTIIIEDSSGVYPVWDMLGRTVEVAHVMKAPAVDIAARFPDHRLAIEKACEGQGGFDSATLEVVHWENAKRIVTYLPSVPDGVLVNMPNKLGRCSYVCRRKPGLDSEIRGAFDDLIWVQLALHFMQTATLSAAAQAVDAPIAVPDDVHEVNVGPGSVIKSREPDKIRRVPLDVPNAAWAAAETLGNEMEYGAVVPEAMSGSIDASVVTGKGVQQLMAGYSQQIANMQQTLSTWFPELIELCFLMDETYWPDFKKSISGHEDGTPYRLDYTPSKDINGDHTVEVQYGGVAGLDPNRALVFLLQNHGAGLISSDLVRRNLPISMNPSEEEAKIHVEQIRGSLIQGLSALIQSAPQMLMNGQDPSETFAKAVHAVKRLEKNERLEDVLAELFPLPEQQEQQIDPATGQPVGGGDGLTPAGMPPGLRPGQATEGPGARPPLEMMFAGLTSSGQPNLQAGVSRMSPARTV